MTHRFETRTRTAAFTRIKSLKLGLVSLVLASGCGTLLAQPQRAEPLSVKAQKAGYRTAETGPNHRKWSRVVLVTNQLGQVSRRTNSFIELSTGLNRKVGANWMESQPELIITNNGVIGRGAQHSAFFAANLHTRGAIQLRTSDGEWLKSHPLCLAYHDSGTGTNVVFAAVRDSVAQVGSNEVVYPDAFDGARASVRYKFTRSGVSQDIEFEAQPDPPESFGLNPATTHLLAISEFVEFPTPVKKERTWRAGGELRRDEVLKFGSLTMIPGRAFKTPRTRDDAGVPVTKTWEVIEGRTVLIERVPYQRITRALRTLPVSSVALTNSTPTEVTNGLNRSRSRRFAAQAALPLQPKPAVPGFGRGEAC